MGDNVFQRASLQVDYVWTAHAAEPGGGAPGGGAQGSLALELRGKRKQRPLRRRGIAVRARCSTACRLTPVLRVRKVRELRRLRARATAASAGTPKRIVFKLSGRRTRALRRAPRRRTRVVAMIRVTARTPGATVTARRRIVLVR